MKTLFAALLGVFFTFQLAAAQQWEIVGKQGNVRTVYVEPSAVKDKFFIAQVLQAVIGKEPSNAPVQVMIFDDKNYTPRALPMTDDQMKHLRAQYNQNPAKQYKKFQWIEVANASASPPKLKRTEAKVAPGYAE